MVKFVSAIGSGVNLVALMYTDKSLSVVTTAEYVGLIAGVSYNGANDLQWIGSHYVNIYGWFLPVVYAGVNQFIDYVSLLVAYLTFITTHSPLGTLAVRLTIRADPKLTLVYVSS